ncbi:MAG TPA: ATP-binding protein [Pyrinomonadaceae bacterium]|jgi:two-component system NtrC family sensor kinase|nr:ATP-binding protein [Pyrinomonadaceae bacterium]
MPVSSVLETQPATLLVIDDDSSAREGLRSIFESVGHRTIAVHDAPAALRFLKKERCDLVMLDVELPEIDGVSLCRLLRAQPSLRQLPVLVFSATDNEQRKVEAFTAGADDYIVKPSTPGELISRVNSHLGMAQRESHLTDANRELRFLADLGRGLLQTLEPEQVARRVAGATFEGLNAALCACVVNNNGHGFAVCAFDREGNAEGVSLVDLPRLEAWLGSSRSSAPALLTNEREFVLVDDRRTTEYVSPIKFGGKILGALVVAFDRGDVDASNECRLIDAAAQQAALAAHISLLYLAARESAATLAEEVDRRAGEAEMHQRFTEAIIDTLPVSLYAIDRDHRIVAWNRNRELGELGVPRGQVLGRNIYDVLTKQKRELLESEFGKVFATGEIQRIEQETVSNSGDTNHWLISKIPMRAAETNEVSHVITVGENITSRVKSERAVARAEKLAAVGRLAAGVVHEINNPLATIAACAESLEKRIAEGAFAESSDVRDLKEYLGLIRDEAFRCKQITNGLLDFSRLRVGNRVPLNLADTIKMTARLVTHQQRGDNIQIEIETVNDLPTVLGDEGQLQQAVVALATNAIDAMPDGGTLTLRTAVSGPNVIVQIKDTGVGISPENLTKIFDPFFTTKDVGRGTGLGLAVCYGIVSEHGGRLDVRSAVGVGTTFTISLPKVSDSN